MKDLCDIGNQVIEAIKKRKPSDVGDLVIAISEIILELREEATELRAAKFDHLFSLFEALTLGG